MDGITAQAIAGLNTAVESLLEDVVAPSVQLGSLVTPTHVAPTGLGGFVGANEIPRGEIFGRRLRATVLVTASADDTGSLDEAVASVAGEFLGTDRVSLLEKGILRVVLDDLGPRATGAEDAFERVLAFDVVYEFLRGPEEAENVIQEVPINLDTS